jgi:hypothetical protein
MSRAQEPQTSAFEGFSRMQNGQIAGIDQGATFRTKLVLPARPSESLISTLTM